jgi:hypothetical protein
MGRARERMDYICSIVQPICCPLGAWGLLFDAVSFGMCEERAPFLRLSSVTGTSRRRTQAEFWEWRAMAWGPLANLDQSEHCGLALYVLKLGVTKIKLIFRHTSQMILIK